MKITHKLLTELVSYSKTTGIFKWKVARRSRGGLTKVGDPVGHLGQAGYVRIILCGREYMAHRLAWFYVNGTWPQLEIDHKNGVRHDNRYKNLRDVSAFTNQQNRRNAASNAKSGLLGAWPASNGKGWRSSIAVDGGKPVFLGYFATAEAAHAAYVKAKRKHHSGCTI